MANPARSNSNMLENGSDTPAKPRKAKTPRKTTKAAAPRATARAAASNEILFTTPPNPNQTPVPPYIWIDFPQNAERLLGPVYNIRLGVGGAEDVEISIDGGLWQKCRLTSGYWWYDWSSIQPGKHVLVARMRTLDGRWFRTPPTACDYRP
jgi:hypothetical protein